MKVFDTPAVTQRAIVLQLLREDHDERWSRAEIERAIPDVDPLTISDALVALRENGAVHLSGELVWPSRCAQHLNELGMVI
jgi:DNA-binding HxlR family transcriptional regulator